MKTQTQLRNGKNRIAVRLGYRSWKHLLEVSESPTVVSTLRYSFLLQGGTDEN